MGRMRTISKDTWKPTSLVAPDGRRYTPSSFREDRELRTKGYVPEPTPSATTAAPAAAPVAASIKPKETEEAPPRVAKDRGSVLYAQGQTLPVDDSDTTPNTKVTTRRSGGTK